MHADQGSQAGSDIINDRGYACDRFFVIFLVGPGHLQRAADVEQGVIREERSEFLPFATVHAAKIRCFNAFDRFDGL